MNKFTAINQLKEVEVRHKISKGKNGEELTDAVIIDADG
jgi:hypothetical protein